jgi:hypothetical protein
VRWYGGWGGCAYLVTLHPSCFSFSSLHNPLPSLPTPKPPCSPLAGWVASVLGGFRAHSRWERHQLLGGRIDCLTELRRFNSTHSCPSHSAFHRPHKIRNIFLNTIHTHKSIIYFYFELIHIVRVAMHRLHFKVPKTNIADFISYSTVLLKYWIILCTLSVYIVALLYFYFKQVCHVELAIRPLHFEVTKISFFVILQMRTTIHYKILSHDQ